MGGGGGGGVWVVKGGGGVGGVDRGEPCLRGRESGGERRERLDSLSPQVGQCIRVPHPYCKGDEYRVQLDLHRFRFLIKSRKSCYVIIAYACSV